MVDSEVHRRLHELLEVVIGEVKITSQEQLGHFSHGRLKFCKLLAIDLGIKRVNIIKMRRGNQMRDAILGRNLAHGNSILQRLRAVIDLPQRVTMYVNHENVGSLARSFKAQNPGTGSRTNPLGPILSESREMQSPQYEV